MTAIRQHDVTLTEGTFSVVLTRQKRVLATITAPLSPLGPLHLVFEMDRGLHPDILRREALAKRGLHPSQIMVGGIFGDIGNFVSKAADTTFNTASKAVTTVARPALHLTRDAVSHAMNGISQITPFLPAHLRNDISNAARVVARARLGDLTAKQFIHTIGQAAKSGVGAARHIGDALLDGSRLVARVVDVPMHVLKNVPGVGNVVATISPFQKFDHMIAAVQRGDLHALKEMVASDLHTFQGVASLIPGIGTGISAGLEAGLAALDGGSPLEIAIHAAYGAIPIPIGIRSVTDAIVGAVMELAKSGNVTDAALAAARSRAPAGFPRDVFDTLARIVAKKVSIQNAGAALASHYVDRFAGQAGSHLLGEAQRLVGSGARLSGPLAPKLGEMAGRALGVGGEWSGDDMRAWGLPGRHVTLGGEEPVAYAVGGEQPTAYVVGGEEPFALAVGGDYEVGGEEPPAYAVGGEEHFEVGAAPELGGISPELLAMLPHPSEWLSGRGHHGG